MGTRAFKNVLRICKDCPLWTSLLKASFKSKYIIPTSASAESDFGELKHNILYYEVKPIAADKFIIIHLKAIEQNTTLFRSKQQRHDIATENT